MRSVLATSLNDCTFNSPSITSSDDTKLKPWKDGVKKALLSTASETHRHTRISQTSLSDHSTTMWCMFTSSHRYSPARLISPLRRRPCTQRRFSETLQPSYKHPARPPAKDTQTLSTRTVEITAVFSICALNSDRILQFKWGKVQFLYSIALLFHWFSMQKHSRWTSLTFVLTSHVFRAKTCSAWTSCKIILEITHVMSLCLVQKCIMQVSVYV